jgi:2-methylcitrate dehydratase PrpD
MSAAATTTTTAIDNRYTRGMAQFVAGLQYEAIPPEVIERIKLLMLDSLGCALYGADLEWSKILQDTLTRVDTSPSCNVWGTNLKLLRATRRTHQWHPGAGL